MRERLDSRRGTDDTLVLMYRTADLLVVVT